VEKDVEVTRDEICSTCRGTGAEPGTSSTRCTTCAGRGEVRQQRQTFLGSMVQVITCPTCNGTGEVISTPCHTCRGRGRERKSVHKIVSIPGGVDNGTQIRLAGEGQPGENSGPNGNLFLELAVKSHAFFHRRDTNIMLNLSINISQAALGAEVEVPTLDGKSKLSIPAGTQPGRVITLKGKGVPRLRGSGRGDELVMIEIEVPTRLTGEQRRLFEELGRTLGSEVKPQEKSFVDKLKEVLGG
jgi:molecular chaperone DnaJ